MKAQRSIERNGGTGLLALGRWLFVVLAVLPPCRLAAFVLL
jgi:hypothetical protein